MLSSSSSISSPNRTSGRAILLQKCAGLDDAQRKRRPVSTSLMSLHGLVRHLSDVEREEYARHNGHADLIRELVDPPS